MTSSESERLDVVALNSDAKQGERMIKEICGFIARFVSYPSEHALVAHALWCVHTHMMERWESTPRLAFLSAEPASGKTRALEVTELLVPRAMEAVNMSPSALFRSVGSENGLPTILFDEIDTVFGPKAKENEEIRGLLNAGHRRGAKTYRSVLAGRKPEVEAIEAFSAVALAGLGWLPDTILSRSIIIRMRRRHAGERVEPFRRRLYAAEGFRIRDMIAAWSMSADTHWPALPNEIQDRDADVWEPLVAIADAIGGGWPARARASAVALVAESKEVESSLGVRLLVDIKSVFQDQCELPSKVILARLLELPEAPWGDLHGKPLDERGLAKRLRAYGVKPKTIRTGTATLRGYSRADLEDQWRRYLPPSPGMSETSATNETVPSKPGTIVADVADVLLFPTKGGTPEGRQCDHCGELGETFECHYGSATARLHRECWDVWCIEYDKRGDGLEIPGFLDRRATQKRGLND